MDVRKAPPRISVVVPVKDHLPELRRLLDDLAAQTRAPDEIVVVDNGPDDAVLALAHARGAVGIREPQPGVAAAAAAGYDAATGDVIARCDADSRLPRRWLAEIEDAMGDPSVSAVTGPGYFYDMPQGARVLRRPASALYMALFRRTMTAALAGPPLFGSSCALRAAAWASVRGEVHRVGTDLHDDVDLAVHLGRHDLAVRWTPRLAVGISADPLRRGARTRMSRGIRSLLLHWPEERPAVRWRRRVHRGLPAIPRWEASLRARLSGAPDHHERSTARTSGRAGGRVGGAC